MKIQNDHRHELIRLLYSAQPIKKFIKNRHIIRMMDGDNGDYKRVVRRSSRIQSKPSLQRVKVGKGVWLRW